MFGEMVLIDISGGIDATNYRVCLMEEIPKICGQEEFRRDCKKISASFSSILEVARSSRSQNAESGDQKIYSDAGNRIL